MNIVYVSKEYGPVTGGGIGTYIANVCRTMAAGGHRVFVVTDCLTEAHKDLLPKGVEAVATEISPPHQRGQFFSENQEYSYRVLHTLRGLAKREKLDVVEFPDYRAEGFGTIRAKRLLDEFAGTKLIVKCHTPTSLLFEINESKLVLPFMICDFELEDYCVKHADAVTSPSLALAHYYRDRLGRTDIRSCPNPIHLPRLPAPRTFDLQQAKTIRFLGQLQFNKGVDLFIIAATKILQTDPDFRFEICGPDRKEPYFGQSYGSVQAGRIPETCKDKIIFAGSVPYDAVPGLLGNCCFCVFPSRWENWANVCLEAMAMGCVVIASNRGGMAEMIEHGKSGFLINPQNPQEIADVILEHHQDLGRLGRISAAAQTRSRELADPERARARILDNYSQPLPARRWLQPAAKKVSVIIPFNHPSQHLAEAIQSVRNSGYRTLEIIVVNRGPADRLANELPEKIEGVVQVRKEDGGLSSARNAGIRAATGDYLMMLDADEEIHADYIATAVQALENNPDLAYVTCHAQRIGASDRACIPPGFVPALMPFLNTDGTRANVYRREAFAAGGGYDEIMVLYEDWDFLLTLHQRGLHGEVLPAEFVFYREQLNSKPGDATCALRAELIQRLLLKYSGGGQKDGRITAAVLAGLWKQEEIRAEMLEHRYAESQDALSQATEGAGPPGWWQRCFEKTLGRKLRRSIRKRLTAARSCFDDQVSG